MPEEEFQPPEGYEIFMRSGVRRVRCTRGDCKYSLPLHRDVGTIIKVMLEVHTSTHLRQDADQ
jgi:hypothetical protein